MHIACGIYRYNEKIKWLMREEKEFQQKIKTINKKKLAHHSCVCVFAHACTHTHVCVYSVERQGKKKMINIC